MSEFEKQSLGIQAAILSGLVILGGKDAAFKIGREGADTWNEMFIKWSERSTAIIGNTLEAMVAVEPK